MTSISRQPCFGIGYGAMKLGKTTDMVMSFPNAIFVAAPGALKPSVSVAGFEPRKVVDAKSLPEIIDLVKSAAKAGFDAVGVDDYTLFVQRQVALLSRSGVGGFDLWGAIYRMTLELREESRRAGVHVWFTMHEIPPHEVAGRRMQGTVALPGNKLPYDVPAAVDLLLRAQAMGDGFGNAIGWPVVYRCNPTDPDWRTGDRHNVTPDMSPVNAGEVLRLYARENKIPEFSPRRIFPWQEALVERGAKVLLDKGAIKDEKAARAILAQFAEHVRKTVSEERHVLWTIRDAWDRAVLTHSLSSHRSKLYF